MRRQRAQGHNRMGGMGLRGLPPMGPPDYLPAPLMPPMPGMRPPPLPILGPVSSRTNSTDPTSKDSRLFVGNLNTLVLKKDAVEAIFSPYGIILAISMHKGYAFVQFTYPDEARLAGANEDGKIYAGQAIDINIVSQPKNRNAQKRSSGGRTSIDAPKKKAFKEGTGKNQSFQRNLVTLSGDAGAKAAANNSLRRAIATAVRKNNGNRPTQSLQSDDILIHGTCQLEFANQKMNCQLRISSDTGDDVNMEGPLVCATCEATLGSPWELIIHCTEEHEMSIYKNDESSHEAADEDDGEGDNNEDEKQEII